MVKAPHRTGLAFPIAHSERGDEHPEARVHARPQDEIMGEVASAGHTAARRRPGLIRKLGHDCIVAAQTTGTSSASCAGCGSQWDYRHTAPVGSFLAYPVRCHSCCRVGPVTAV